MFRQIKIENNDMVNMYFVNKHVLRRQLTLQLQDEVLVGKNLAFSIWVLLL